ncbi:MAG: hypothetical protein AAF202_08910, partial [Pseudomonadota bacterium]
MASGLLTHKTMKWWILVGIFSSFTALAGPSEPRTCVDEMHNRPTDSVITEKALRHILEGDFGQNPRTRQPWLKGGMHTYQALEAFMQQRDDIFELGFEEIKIVSEKSQLSSWYHIMENP